jgi:hypothetical protein
MMDRKSIVQCLFLLTVIFVMTVSHGCENVKSLVSSSCPITKDLEAKQPLYKGCGALMKKQSDCQFPDWIQNSGLGADDKVIVYCDHLLLNEENL